jgi:hypothetical protein
MHPERAKLDKQLVRKGQNMVLKRRIGTSNSYATITLRASVRGNRGVPMIGTITQQFHEIIASVSQLLAADPAVWPGAANGPLWPQANDTVVLYGRDKQISAATPILLNDEPVRVEITVGG